MKNYFFIALLFGCVLTACDPKQEEPQQPTPQQEDDGMRHDSLAANYENFSNPERGFHIFRDYKNPIATPLTYSEVHTIYEQGTTLILTNYYLYKYRHSAIPEEYLNAVRSNMEALRAGGCKCVIRFAYTDGDEYTLDTNTEDREAPLDIILQHIAQIKPILQEYADVIYVMEAGFVGVWGEWHYTTYFKFNPTAPEDFADYRKVLDALLDALPKERMVCVRRPAFKMGCYGWTIADTLTRAEAYSGTAKARLASHDDAFMANISDMGTFKDPNDRPYWEAESKYTIYGGESNLPGNRSKCDPTLAQMHAMHMSYLNISYHTTVIGRWQKEGCLEDIRRQLGYRFVVRDVATTKAPKAGQELQAIVTLENEGFASPKNPRDIRMLLINKANPKDVITVVPDCDPRFWGPEGEHKINVSFKPKSAGEYNLYLYLPDPKPNLANDPRYAIRLANKDCWDAKTGYNYLTTVTVE